ncbi:MAG: AraC family transcriptional regulator [Mailhella sp.]|nr:AraC family transcriptional regulator [Mailhella sp.]
MNEPDKQQIGEYEQLAHEIIRLAPQAGVFSTKVPGMRIVRRETSEFLEHILYPSSLCLIVKGRMQAFIGSEEYRCERGQLLLNCIEMPGYLRASADAGEPFLAFVIALDANLLVRIFDELTGRTEEVPVDSRGEASSFESWPAEYFGTERSVRTGEASLEQIRAFLHLAQIADHADWARFIAPLILRELHYYLAAGPLGGYLHTFFSPSSQSRRIATAAAHMCGHCGERLRIEELARMVSMAESTFNRNFKKVTSLSPLQYHKQLKLHEARRLMSAENMSASAACFAVGYESQQQFTREYKRLFGRPPMKDVRRNS